MFVLSRLIGTYSRRLAGNVPASCLLDLVISLANQEQNRFISQKDSLIMSISPKTTAVVYEPETDVVLFIC